MRYSEIKTPLGLMIAGVNANGLARLEFKDEAGEGFDLAIDGLNEADFNYESTVLFKTLQFELEAYFEGKLKRFTVPVHPEGTPFQQKVWESLSQIAFGTTITYKQQSIAMGMPDAIRAIASANGKNPIAILIPCHRVIGGNGSLTGYSGGLWRKQQLLQLENSSQLKIAF